jgi:hypothetical protein
VAVAEKRDWNVKPYPVCTQHQFIIIFSEDQIYDITSFDCIVSATLRSLCEEIDTNYMKNEKLASCDCLKKSWVGIFSISMVVVVGYAQKSLSV